MTSTSHLACWKSRKFPISEGEKKEILKNLHKYKSIVYKNYKLRTNCAPLFNIIFKNISRFLWYIILFLTEHIRVSLCSSFVLIFLPNLSFDALNKVYLVNKKECIHTYCTPKVHAKELVSVILEMCFCSSVHNCLISIFIFYRNFA